ncbi:BfmA/BtgA family mobilization protein [Algibacter lectus]|uniref:BfmA/BtgA family mobilization protein n=1 Tax=Algibacter lectus TaxID=221126 RepID=UPI002495202E|nr:BfmA/BtgA family mobilization protein [Algibacter lectus]
MTKKSILISPLHHKELKKLSESNRLSYYKLVEEMIMYFKKTGIDPTDSKNESPSKGLKELDKRLVSFLKVQERDILKPMRQDIYENSKDQKQQIENVYTNLIEALNSLNGFGNNRRDRIIEEIANQEISIKKIEEQQLNLKSDLLREIIKQEKAIIEIYNLIKAQNESGFFNRIKNIFKNADKQTS